MDAVQSATKRDFDVHLAAPPDPSGLVRLEIPVRFRQLTRGGEEGGEDSGFVLTTLDAAQAPPSMRPVFGVRSVPLRLPLAARAHG